MKTGDMDDKNIKSRCKPMVYKSHLRYSLNHWILAPDSCWKGVRAHEESEDFVGANLGYIIFFL